ncbi:MAG: plasmid stabilization protein [Sulfuricella sp.]|nr:plasmid stabilization protein [Sulfuricella sp.]
MASLTIRNLDEELKSRLRLQAARHGCSMEQEARWILSQAVMPTANPTAFAQRIQQRFAGLDADNLPLPERRPARIPSEPDA